jgi:DNA gyrase subunit A
VKIEDGDQLFAAALTDGQREFLIATKQGQSIRFTEEQVRSMGRGTVGVKAIDVAENDQVVGLAVTEPDRQHVLAVCEKGYGKRTLLEEFRQQNRGGKGIILIDASERNGPVVDIKLVKGGDEVMLITDRGQTLRTTVAEIRETGRNAQGVRIMDVDAEEKVVAVERLAESNLPGAGGSEMPPTGDAGDGDGGAGEGSPSLSPDPGTGDGELN